MYYAEFNQNRLGRGPRLKLKDFHKRISTKSMVFVLNCPLESGHSYFFPSSSMGLALGLPVGWIPSLYSPRITKHPFHINIFHINNVI